MIGYDDEQPSALAAASRRETLRRALVAAVSFGFLACLGVTLALWSDVRVKLEDLATSKSDISLWTLSQTEVDFLLFKDALATAVQTENPDLTSVRRRFDVFYSRAESVSEGRMYRIFAANADYDAATKVISAFLDRQVPLMDGSDQGLIAALPAILHDARVVQPTVRSVPLLGIETLATVSVSERNRISDLLLRVAFVTILLIVALFVVVVMLERLNRLETHRRQELGRTTERLKTVIRTSLDAILVADQDGRLIEFNAAAEATFGLPRDQAIGRALSDLLIRPGTCAGLNLIEGDADCIVGQGRVEAEGRRSDGGTFPIEVSIAAAQGESGRIFVAFLRDISQRILFEHELRKARDKALAGEKAKAEFLAVMSHEMRTPLNGLLGTLELLEATELTDRQRRFTRTILSSGGQLLHHVNDVLDVARLDAGPIRLSRERFSIHALLADLVESQKGPIQNSGNTVTIQIAGGVPDFVIGDERRLRQVLLNLLGNAIKFTRNGKITLECAAAADPNLIEFRVIDTGIGIATYQLETIFDDFVTLDASYDRQTGGTGLGLGIARRLVRVMGGDLSVASRQGQGSVFSVRLPLPAAQPIARSRQGGTAVAAVMPKPGGPSLSRRVLIVEDNETNRFLLREMLTRAGHQVEEAHDGLQGVAMANAGAYDIIFMDISMPNMNGMEATRAIRAGGGPCAETPIIAVTAHALTQELVSFAEAGMTATLTKPISGRQVQQAVIDHCALLTPTINPDRLVESAKLLGLGRFSGLLDQFLTEADGTVSRVSQQIAAQEAAQTIPDLHHLAGSAATFGADQLEAELNRLEARWKEAGQLPDGEDALRLARLWQATRDQINDWRAHAA